MTPRAMSTPNICAGPFGAAYDFYIERPRLMQLLGRAVWGIDARPLYASIARIGRLEAGETVIDVPCGGGVALRSVSPGQQVRYLAGDIDSTMVERTRRRALKRGLTQVQTGIADLESLPYQDASADLFACFSGLHMLADPSRAIQEIARCLKPGGEVIGTTFLLQGRRRQRVLFASGARRGHPEPPEHSALAAMFDLAGFKRVQIAPAEGFAAFSAQRG
jgi:SAM-dependent methyltransferase